METDVESYQEWRESKRAKRVRISVSDFVLRSHGSCSHLSHEMVLVEASVMTMRFGKTLQEKVFRAFYCEEYEKCFVTNSTFEGLIESRWGMSNMQEAISKWRTAGNATSYLFRKSVS